MANDVTIVVEASLGDTLIKLDLAKRAISDLGTASEEAAVKQDAAAASTGLFSTAMSDLTQTTTLAVPMLGSFTVPLIAIPGIVVVAIAAIVALADTIGTLVAITADFVAPLALVAGLLGSLGLGFLLGAQRAAQGGGALSAFADKLKMLTSMFHETTDILAHAFLPYLLQLADAAQKALLFIDKLAREPLAKAMHDMATQGVQMLNQFVNSIAAVVAKPIRLAFKIAFGAGPGGNEIASVVADWWHRFSDFLFGYSQQHQIHIGRFLGPVTSTQVDGIFQPIIDWFNRHHFTRQGIQIGHEILSGLMNAGVAQRLGTFIDQVLVDAFKTALRAVYQLWLIQNRLMVAAVIWVAQQIVSLLGRAWDFISQHIHGVVQAVLALAGVVGGAVVGAFQSVLGVISSIIGGIQSAIGLAQSLASAAGGLVGTITGPSAPGGRPVPVLPHSSHVVFNTHFHAAMGMSPAAERAAFERFSRSVGMAQIRQGAMLAGGY